MTDELHKSVPAAGTGPVTHEQWRAIWAEMRSQGREHSAAQADQAKQIGNLAVTVDRVLEALQGEDGLNPDAKVGLVGHVKQLRSDLAEHLDQHESDGAKRLTLKHGAALAAVSATLSACATKIVEAFSRGTTPPGHP